MVDEKSIEKLTARLKKVQSSIEDKIKIIELSKAKDSVFWSKMRKELDKDFEKCRNIFSDFLSVEMPKEYKDVIKLQIAKIKKYGPANASYSEFIKQNNNNQTLSAILNDANAAFFIGTESGQKTLIRLMSVCQQLNIREDEITKAISEGFEDTGSVYGPIKRLKKELLEKSKDGKFVTVIDKNGKTRRYTTDYYAELVARTKLMEASTAGVINTATKYGADLIQVSAHNTETEYDSWFEGKIFSLSGNDPDFELAPDVPPFHVNCKHGISIVYREALAAQGTLGKFIDFSNGLLETHPTRTSFIPVSQRGFNNK